MKTLTVGWLALVLAACGASSSVSEEALTSSTSGNALELCAKAQPNAVALASDAELTDAYLTTVGEAIEWQRERGPTDGHGDSRISSAELRPDETVAICYFSGTSFAAPSRPGSPPYTQLSVIVSESGTVLLDQAHSDKSAPGIDDADRAPEGAARATPD